MENFYEYYKKFDWSSNPFTFTISPRLMVGYSSQLESILTHIFNLHKIALVIGATGSGKTTLLTWLDDFINTNKDGFQSFYIPKPPSDEKSMILLFKSLFNFSLFDRLMFKEIDVVNLPKFLIKKTRKTKTVLLIDESHECPVEVLEWLRTLSDVVPNILIVFAGLSTFENTIETKLPTLSMRVVTKVYLESLSDVETESLIRKRIESVGGKGLGPFSPEAVIRIFEITGGFPREIIKACDKLVRVAAEKNISSINRSFVDQVLKESQIPKQVEIKTSLSKKQKDILTILNNDPNLNPTEIVERLGIGEYKDKNNAIRSVNNILKRLMRDGLVNRKKLGNTYVYFLSGKAKTLLAEA